MISEAICNSCAAARLQHGMLESGCVLGVSTTKHRPNTDFFVARMLFASTTGHLSIGNHSVILSGHVLSGHASVWA